MQFEDLENTFNDVFNDVKTQLGPFLNTHAII